MITSLLFIIIETMSILDNISELDYFTDFNGCFSNQLGWEYKNSLSSYNKKYVIKSYTQFKCSCGNKWSSIKGVYWIMFNQDKDCYGVILFKQGCKKCNEYAEYFQFTQELEKCVGKVLVKLKTRPKKSGFKDTNCSSNIKGNHDSQLCAACKNSVCVSNLERSLSILKL